MASCFNLNHIVKYSLNQIKSSIRPLGKTIHFVGVRECVCNGHCYFFTCPTSLPLGNCPPSLYEIMMGLLSSLTQSGLMSQVAKVPYSPGPNNWSKLGLLESFNGHYLVVWEKGHFFWITS